MKRLKIHGEGKWIIIFTLFVLVVMNFLLYSQFSRPLLAIITFVSIGLFIFVLFFFRNPNRNVHIEDPNLLIAPADGKIVVIEPTNETEYFGKKMLQVSIFMSIFDVHANWYPISGKVLKATHRSGNHYAAYAPKASSENERASVVIETISKKQIMVRQIAGALARRIVTYAKEGEMCQLNEQIGFIKLGSRIDLFLPLDTHIFVEIGDPTKGNETIIGRLNS